MQAETYSAYWLHCSQSVSIHDLVDLSGLTESEVIALVDAGALMPVNLDAPPWTFSAECVVTVRKACRLRDELELDSHAVALTLTLLEQIRTLEAELAQLRARQPVFGHF